MALDAKRRDPAGLRLDRSAVAEPQTPAWARTYILIGVGIFVLLGVAALVYRFLAGSTPEVEVVRASAEGSDIGGAVLTATGYIVPHHKIEANSKVTGRV